MSFHGRWLPITLFASSLLQEHGQWIWRCRLKVPSIGRSGEQPADKNVAFLLVTDSRERAPLLIARKPPKGPQRKCMKTQYTNLHTSWHRFRHKLASGGPVSLNFSKHLIGVWPIFLVKGDVYLWGNKHISPWEKENNLQKCHGRGYVSSQDPGDSKWPFWDG